MRDSTACAADEFLFTIARALGTGDVDPDKVELRIELSQWGQFCQFSDKLLLSPVFILHISLLRSMAPRIPISSRSRAATIICPHLGHQPGEEGWE